MDGKIKDKERVKASKLLKLINKYETMYRPEKKDIVVHLGMNYRKRRRHMTDLNLC